MACWKSQQGTELEAITVLTCNLLPKPARYSTGSHNIAGITYMEACGLGPGARGVARGNAKAKRPRWRLSVHGAKARHVAKA